MQNLTEDTTQTRNCPQNTNQQSVEIKQGSRKNYPSRCKKSGLDLADTYIHKHNLLVPEW